MKTYSIRAVTAATIAAVTDPCVSEQTKETQMATHLRRLKGLVEADVLNASQKPGSGRTAPRYLNITEACIGAVFCILGDYGFDLPTFRHLRSGLMPRPNGVLEGRDENGVHFSKYYWGENPHAEYATICPEPNMDSVIAAIQSDADWTYVIMLARDSGGNPVHHSFAALTDSVDLEVKASVERWRAIHKHQGVVEIGHFRVNLSDILERVLTSLHSEEGEV